MNKQAYRQEEKLSALWADLIAFDATYAGTYVHHMIDGWWACDREWTPAGTYHNDFAYLGWTAKQAFTTLRRWIRNLEKAAA